MIINCDSAFLLPAPVGEKPGPTILETLNVPIIQAVHSSAKTQDTWEKDPQGIHPSNQIYWVAQPEFNGCVEPVVLSARDEMDDDPYGMRKPIPERVLFLLDRVSAWLSLSRTPVHKRRVTFLLHKNPCAGAEASVAGGAGLDTLESVVRIHAAAGPKGLCGFKLPERR